MAFKDDLFTIRELAQSAFKAFASTNSEIEYRTIFYNTTGDMEDTTMLTGAIVNNSFFEFKLTRRRDPIEDEPAPFEGIKDLTKTVLMKKYFAFVKQYYPLLNMRSTINRIFINHCGYDYEITFIAKKGVKIDE